MPQQFVSQQGTVGRWATEAPDDFDSSGDEDGFWPVTRLKQGYLDYLAAKQLEISEQQEARHYRHGSHWTAEEVRELRRRGQHPITFNRVSRKVNQIVGLIQRMQSDPKAFPRNPKNADGAEIATQCVRSVLDASNWKFIDPMAADFAATEGIGGVEFKLVDGDHGDDDLLLDFFFNEDFFYDPRSRKPDFSDARYMGLAKWLDIEAAVELFPDQEDEIRSLMVDTGFDLTTHADQEYKWILVNEQRLRLVEHWYRHRSQWYWAFYSSNMLLAQGLSPFFGERRERICRFEPFSAAVDHDGDRYGLVRDMKGPQDEINHRRSKALHMSNVTRITIQKGAVDDVERTRKEKARPDGVVEYNPGFAPPEADDKTADLQAQLALMQDARSEIDSFANIQPDLITRDVPGDHSGVAINLLQKAGIAELGPFLRNYKAWKDGVYKKVWNIVRRIWTAERFLRVTDSEGLAQFIQINGMDEDPQTGQPVIVNAIGNLSVEMTIEEGPDEASLTQDAYDTLKQYPPGVIPPAVLIELSPLTSQRKQRVLQLLQQPVDPLAIQAKQLALAKVGAEINAKNAEAERHRSQSVTDGARAAHLGSEANLNAVEMFNRATQRAEAGDQGPNVQPSQPQQFGQPQQPPQMPDAAPPPPQGQQMPRPMMPGA